MKEKRPVNSVIKTLFVFLMSAAVLIAFGFANVAFAADGGTAGTAPKGGAGSSAVTQTWDHSKSKTAANLDGKYESEITLSLPSKEEQLTTEICFVLDKSSFSDTKTKAMELLDHLKTETDKSGAKVKVDIVSFNRTAHNRGSFDLSTQYQEIESTFVKKESGGTNMHAGLLLAEEVLKKDSTIPDSRKYMILVSDGDTYLYCKNGDYNTPYSRSFIPVASAGATAYGGYYDESWYYPSAPYGKNVGRPSDKDSTPEKWDAYLQDVKERNTESHGDDYDYIWKYYDGWQITAPTKENPDGFKTQPTSDQDHNKITRLASNLDMGFLHAAETYHRLAEKYHCYSIPVQSFNQADGGHPGFMEYLNGGVAVDFSAIENKVLYFLGAGSTVTDQIGYKKDGYNFDLADPAQMKLTVDDAQGKTQTYDAEKIGENHYGFLKQQDGTYAYEAIYTPGDKKEGEQIEWKINVPVTNFQHASLKYKVKLTDPQTAPGTYGQLDLDGNQVIDGTNTAVDSTKAIYTNTSAVLMPKDSDGNAGTPEEFGRPSVCYTVRNSAPAEEHTITFHPNNGQAAFLQTVSDGEQAVKPESPTKKGYTFKGWYSDRSLKKAYDFKTSVKSNLDLYAKWVKNTSGTKPDKPANKVTGILLPKVIAKGRHTQILTWTALKNVDGYFIYTNHCHEGRKRHYFKKVADYKASKARVYTAKKLNTYENYKYYVAAYTVKKNGRKQIVKKSVTVHSVCGNTSAKNTNVTAIKVKKHAVTIKKGQTYRIKATIYKIHKKRDILDETHCGRLRYLTKDSSIATVDYNTGRVKGRKAGKTTVYVLGVNGVRDKVAITVK